MEYYVIQVLTGEEVKYRELAYKTIPPIGYTLIMFQREIFHRRRGKKIKILAPLFSGYIFLYIEKFNYSLFSSLRKINGYICFPKANQNILPVDKEIAKFFDIILKEENSAIIKTSMGIRNTITNKVEIIDGPLKSIQGNIVSINERENKAKVEIKLFNRKIFVNLGINVIRNNEFNELLRL